MHADDRPVGADLARRLIAEQMPSLADQRLWPVQSSGTDNVIFRLGDGLCARFPRTPQAGALVGKERRWLPVLAPHLPLAIPEPRHAGQPVSGYPFDWTVSNWIAGQDAAVAPPWDMANLARDLAGFVRALRSVSTDLAGTGRPAGRGGPLKDRDVFLRQMIAAVTDEGDLDEWTTFWNEALALPPCEGPPVWLHGDLHGANLLLRQGRLAAVIDWGCLGLGDPAYDLAPAWFIFDPPERALFMAELPADAASLARARALAGSTAMMAIPYYRHSNPGLLSMAKRTLDRVLDDWRGSDCLAGDRSL